jgi:hypothetical protein
VDLVLEGATYDKALFIISDKYEEIKQTIIEDLDRVEQSFMVKECTARMLRKLFTPQKSPRIGNAQRIYLRDRPKKHLISVMNTHEISWRRI